MHSVIRYIKENYSYAIVGHCSEQGCKLILDCLSRFSGSVILKGEELGTSDKICDYLIFLGNSKITICAIEMKGKNWASDKVNKKLENGRIEAQKIIRKTKQSISKEQISFIPVLLKRGRNPSDVKQLQKDRNRIGKQSIIIGDCGSCLSQVLEIKNL